LGTESEKRIIMRIDPNDESITLKDIMQRIQEIQRQHPDLDVFFDGDEYAARGRRRLGRSPRPSKAARRRRRPKPFGGAPHSAAHGG